MAITDSASPPSPFLNAIVAVIGNEHGSVGRDCNRHRVLELARATAPASEAREKNAVRGKFLDPVIVEVGNKDVALGPVRVPYGSMPAAPVPRPGIRGVSSIAKTWPTDAKVALVERCLSAIIHRIRGVCST